MILNFINKVSTDLLQHNFEFILASSETVYADGMSCAGYFDYGKKLLVVAALDPNWLSTLAHEYAHFVQWKNNRFFGDAEQKKHSDFDAWINDKYNAEYTPEYILECARQVQRCELDAERQTLDFLVNYGLTIDKVEEHIKQANAYVWFYEVVRQVGRWETDEDYSDDDDIMALVPTQFISDVSNVPPRFVELVKERCFGIQPFAIPQPIEEDSMSSESVLLYLKDKELKSAVDPEAEQAVI